jgi:hypothetical protein
MLEDLTPPVKRTPCKVRTILQQLDEKDEGILLKALTDDEAWSGNALARALSQRGLIITEKPIRKHRNSECSC